MAYRLSLTDDVASAVRKCAEAQLAHAAGRLRAAGEDPVEAIHDARKSLKKTRSLLRLVRPALGRGAYAAENGALREIAAALSLARDADVVAAAVPLLATRFAGRLPASDFEAVHAALLAEAEAGHDGGGSADGHAAVLDELHAARARVAAWPLDGADWDTVLAGAVRGYARGDAARRAARRAPSVERLHEWRKRAKDLWYHERLLRDCWRPLVGAHGEQAHALTDLLGDDHDLWLLHDRLARGIALPPGATVDLCPLIALVEARREELQRDAHRLGARLYAERPGAFERRLSRYLRAALRERGDA